MTTIRVNREETTVGCVREGDLLVVNPGKPDEYVRMIVKEHPGKYALVSPHNGFTLTGISEKSPEALVERYCALLSPARIEIISKGDLEIDFRGKARRLT